ELARLVASETRLASRRDEAEQQIRLTVAAAQRRHHNLHRRGAWAELRDDHHGSTFADSLRDCGRDEDRRGFAPEIEEGAAGERSAMKRLQPASRQPQPGLRARALKEKGAGEARAEALRGEPLARGNPAANVATSRQFAPAVDQELRVRMEHRIRLRSGRGKLRTGTSATEMQGFPGEMRSGAIRAGGSRIEITWRIGPWGCGS